MTSADYLIRAIHKTGTRHVFGIQDDYVLNFYNRLCQSGLAVINTCDEQGAGFSADAYARLTGFGVVCVTYGVGGLKLVNNSTGLCGACACACHQRGARPLRTPRRPPPAS